MTRCRAVFPRSLDLGWVLPLCVCVCVCIHMHTSTCVFVCTPTISQCPPIDPVVHPAAIMWAVPDWGRASGLTLLCSPGWFRLISILSIPAPSLAVVLAQVLPCSFEMRCSRAGYPDWVGKNSGPRDPACPLCSISFPPVSGEAFEKASALPITS